MRHRCTFACLFLAPFLFAAGRSAAQQAAVSPDPAEALADGLAAACRLDEAKFANFFAGDNASTFLALPDDQRRRFIQRFSLSDEPGKALRSSDQDGHLVLRCEAPAGSTQFRFGAVRVHENLAFIPVTVGDTQEADFGFVRESGGWKLLSLGLVLLDIKQLAVQWAQADMDVKQNAAAVAIQELADAIDRYRRAFGRLPDSLTQLGPAAKNQISPEHASLVDADLAAGTQGGYRFRYRVAAAGDLPDQFELEAMPQNYGDSGRKSFFRDAKGQIHAADHRGAPANAADPLLRDDGTP